MEYISNNYKEIRNIKDITELIRIWECEAGESFMDYFGDNYIFTNISFFLGYISVKYSDLYYFLINASDGKIPWKYPQDGLIDLIETFYGEEDYSYFNETRYCKSLKPWINLIIDNDIYWERFIKHMFIEKDHTTDNTSWFECYDIKKLFEEYLEEK